MSGLSSADERPRDVTLVVNRTEASRHANGRVDTRASVLWIYYGTDGTAYVQLGQQSSGAGVGVVISPNMSSGSHSSVEQPPPGLSLPPQRETLAASISGQMSNLNITCTMNSCDVDGTRCFESMRRVVLQVSGTTCAVIGGTYTAKSDSTAPNPTVATSIVGPQTCSVRLGRHIGN
jgi:hypothetical protein